MKIIIWNLRTDCTMAFLAYSPGSDICDAGHLTQEWLKINRSCTEFKIWFSCKILNIKIMLILVQHEHC